LKYSVVIPVYNAALTLHSLVKKLQAVFSELESDFELIFVDDFSQDDSWRIIEELHWDFPKQIKGVKLVQNFGQQSATFCGFSFASGDFIISIDDDLQLPPSEIKKLIQQQKKRDYDIVYANYRKKQQHLIRNIGSQIFQFSQKKFWNLPQGFSSFRLIKKEVIQKVILYKGEKLFIDTLLMRNTQKRGFVFINHQERKKGKSAYTFRKLFSVLWHSFISILENPSSPKKNFKATKPLFIIEKRL